MRELGSTSLVIATVLKACARSIDQQVTPTTCGLRAFSRFASFAQEYELASRIQTSCPAACNAPTKYSKPNCGRSAGCRTSRGRFNNNFFIAVYLGHEIQN